MNCLNCDEPIKKEWTHCPACGANLRTKKYSQVDDPIADQNERLTKIEKTLVELTKERNKKDVDEGQATENKHTRKTGD